MPSKPLIPYDEVKATRDTRREVKLRAPIKKVNRERQSAKAASEGFDPDYLAWVRTQPSILTGHLGGKWSEGEDRTSPRWQFGHWVLIVAMHMKHGRTKGTDSTALPGEDWLHKEMHKIGIKSWADKYGFDIPALIAVHRKRYSLELAEKVKAGKVKET